jgi:hypothetical protein
MKACPATMITCAVLSVHRPRIGLTENISVQTQPIGAAYVLVAVTTC